MKVEAFIDPLQFNLWEVRITVNTVVVKLETVQGEHARAKDVALSLLTALQRKAGTANITTTGTL